MVTSKCVVTVATKSEGQTARRSSCVRSQLRFDPGEVLIRELPSASRPHRQSDHALYESPLGQKGVKFQRIDWRINQARAQIPRHAQDDSVLVCPLSQGAQDSKRPGVAGRFWVPTQRDTQVAEGLAQVARTTPDRTGDSEQRLPDVKRPVV